MRFALRHTLYASLPALVLAACGEAGEDDAERAAREASDAAHSAGEAIEEGWKSGDDERAELAEETGEAVEAAGAQVRAEWHEHRNDRRAALEAAGDHVAAAGAAVASGLGAAVDAYARTVDDGVDADDFHDTEPRFDQFATQDEPVGEEPLDGSIELEAEAEVDLEGSQEAEAEAEIEIDRDDGDREYVPSHKLEVEIHPCAEHDREACDHTEEEHAQCTPERG
ncbi:MAG: hypothetical protein RKE49_02355 [Oceanicaulis sp.]